MRRAYCTSSHVGRFQLGLRNSAAGWYVTMHQPIATGVAGYQTGQTSAVVNPLYSGFGTSNFTSLRFGGSPYVLFPNAQPITFRAYLQLPL